MSVILTAEEIGPKHIGLPVKVTVFRRDGRPATVEIVEVGVLWGLSIERTKVYWRFKGLETASFYVPSTFRAEFEFEDYAV